MVYLEGISAFEFWTSLARAQVNIRTVPRVSSLEACPATERESAAVSLGSIPCAFSQLVAAVPDASFRVQRKRFKYHVWNNPVPPDSFVVLTREVCIASPALTLAQMSRRLSVPKLSQSICEMRGSYLPLRGRGEGMLDELDPIVTEDEIRATIAKTKNVHDCTRLQTALRFSEENSASPKETELLLLLCMTKRRGGADVGGWVMNLPLDVPFQYRKFLGKATVRPDLLNIDKKVVIEYDSSEAHDDFVRAIDDRKRAKVLRAMGFQVISLHWEDVVDALAFEESLRLVKEALGLPYRRTSKEGLAARQRLMQELRTMPEIGYP